MNKATQYHVSEPLLSLKTIRKRDVKNYNHYSLVHLEYFAIIAK